MFMGFSQQITCVWHHHEFHESIAPRSLFLDCVACWLCHNTIISVGGRTLLVLYSSDSSNFASVWTIALNIIWSNHRESSPLNQLNDMVLQIVCKISGCCFFVNNRRCDAQVRIGSNHFWARDARQIAPLGISSTFIHRVTGRFAFTQPSRHQSQIHITCQHPNGSAWRGRCLGHTLVPCGCTRRLSMPTQDIW